MTARNKRSFPTFLGIGVPKAGTTWLHNLLASHPQVFLPSKRKEIRYFDQYYHRGLDWYSSFFPDYKNQFSQIGEISPQYLYCEICPGRIRKVGSIKKFIVILRNPVYRTVSQYRFCMRVQNYRGSFTEFQRDMPDYIEWGFYSKGLKNYIASFGREKILILLFEQIFRDVASTKARIAEFLEIGRELFPIDAGLDKVNPSYLPKFRSLYAFAHRVDHLLMKKDLHWLSVFYKRKLRIQEIFGRSSFNADIPFSSRVSLYKKYEREISDLETLLNLDLSLWLEDFVQN